MLAKNSILSNLRTLDRRYAKAGTPRDALFYSKLAVLELCGWIEESMDVLVLACAARHLRDGANLKFCEERIVRKNYGFDYDRNFRSMLIELVGLVAVEKLERTVDAAKYDQFRSTLASLKKIRDGEAHTHLKGTTRTLNAPSVTLGQLQPIYDGLVEFDRAIRTLRF